MIEATSQLYRSIATIQPWLYYLLEAYQGPEKVLGVFLSAAYMVSKGSDLVSRGKLFRTAVWKLLQNVVRCSYFVNRYTIRVKYSMKNVYSTEYRRFPIQRTTHRGGRHMRNLSRGVRNAGTIKMQAYFLRNLRLDLAGSRVNLSAVPRADHRRSGLPRRSHDIFSSVILIIIA